MKKILTIVAILFSVTVYSQSVIKKGYAYYRETYPGIIKVQMDDKGNPIEEPPQVRKEYFIYISTVKGKKISISNIYLDGKSFTVITDSIKETPVVLVTPFTTDKSTRDTLVPRSTYQVYKLTLLQPSGKNNNSSSLKKLMASKKVVIEYTLSNKRYYFGIPELKKLPPLPMP